MPTFLPTKSADVRTGFFFQREERVGMLLRGHREAADRDVLFVKTASIPATLAGRRLDLVAAGGQPPRSHRCRARQRCMWKSSPSLLEIAKLMRTGLAQLGAAAEPPELHVERGGFAAGAVGQCDGGDSDAGTGLQQRSTTQDCSVGPAMVKPPCCWFCRSSSHYRVIARSAILGPTRIPIRQRHASGFARLSCR